MSILRSLLEAYFDYDLHAAYTAAYKKLEQEPNEENYNEFKRLEAEFKEMKSAYEADLEADRPKIEDQNEDDDYRDQHQAPDFESGAPAHDVTLNGIYPDDFYGPDGCRYYCVGMEDAYWKVRGLYNKPNNNVRVYRAVPSDLAGVGINPGDWVAITRSYAKDHGEGRFDGDYRIISKQVQARDIFTNGDSIEEWGYDPQK